jgi:polysaccharide deacetylase family protein (PEP-CTERM system associated)
MAVVNAMSVDVEDYYHVSAFEASVERSRWPEFESRVVANTQRLLDLFDEFNVRSTFFVLGWIAARHPDLVREIAMRGHEVASHGYEHRLVYAQRPEEFRADVRRSKRELEDLISWPVVGYRAPSYSVTRRSLWALTILAEEGFEYDSSIFPIWHDRYGIPGASRHLYVIDLENGSHIVEVPPSTVRIAGTNLPAAGGGYLRILPYAWTQWSLSRINRHEGRPAIFYLHPWEIDPGQPRLPADALGRFRHYRHLGKTEGRLRRLLQTFQFGPIRSLVGNLPIAVDRMATALPVRALS